MQKSMDYTDKELKINVLIQVLSLIRESIDLYNRGFYWYALNNLKTLSSSLVLEDEQYEKLDEIVHEIELIEKEVGTKNYPLTISWGVNKAFRNDIKNKKSRKLFPTVLREIQKLLRDANYYEFMKSGSILNFDPSLGSKSGKQDIERKGLTIGSARAGEHNKQVDENDN